MATSIPIPPPVAVRIYAARINQDDTDAPVATVLQNTTGATITWSRDGTGAYKATADTVNLWPYDQTQIQLTYNEQGEILAATWDDEQTILLNKYGSVTPFTADDNITDLYVEIKSYNVTPIES